MVTRQKLGVGTPSSTIRKNVRSGCHDATRFYCQVVSVAVALSVRDWPYRLVVGVRTAVPLRSDGIPRTVPEISDSSRRPTSRSKKAFANRSFGVFTLFAVTRPLPDGSDHPPNAAQRLLSTVATAAP